MSTYRLGEDETFSDKAKRWFYSRKNIAGCGVAVVGAPALVLTGLAAPPLALALIPLFYAVGALVAPTDRKEQHELEYNLTHSDTENVENALDAITETINGKVSPAVQQKVFSIAVTVRTILPKAGRLGVGSDEMHILRRTATDYLPSTLSPYLAMPRRYAEKTVVSEGMTSEQILLSQLDLIDAKLRHISDAVTENDVAAILSNGQFLKERFGVEKFALPDSDGTTR